MKKINLRGISETLGEKELKNVTGGIYNSDTLGSEGLHDFDGGSGSGTNESPRITACNGKSATSQCTWKDANDKVHSGRCVALLGAFYCADL
ncbi:MAG: hypothetical protein LBO74_09120 [Candidatus Symbiothrix sp.]|jgi:bacteriocin-like protein|nr:hypothetical protein [Candidatus Symbiothrix sp.]